MSREKQLTDSVLALIGILTLIPLMAMWRGYVLSVLWAWFITPFFRQPPLSIALAIGVSLMVSMLTNHRTGREIEKEATVFHGFGMGLLVPAIVLAMGWIVSKFL